MAPAARLVARSMRARPIRSTSAVIDRTSPERIAAALLGKPLTDERLLKLRRHLTRDPWSVNPVMDPKRIEKLLNAVEQHQNGGENARAFVHHSLVNMPARTIPELPKDIQAKVEKFQKDMAAQKAK